jgi:hypothetical protein
MKGSRWQHREADDSSGFDDGGFGFWHPPPMSVNRAMGSIDGFNADEGGAEKPPDDITEPVAAIGHRKELELIVWPVAPPAAGDSIGGGDSGECALKFVGDDKDLQDHGVVDVNLKAAGEEA